MAKDYAPGLPSKSQLGDLSKVREGDFVDFIIQRHDAEKAGKHYDVRFGTKGTGLFSWATKKELPKPGERIALFQQPLHRYSYKDFEGEIPAGYGKGKVKKQEEGRLLIREVKDNSIHFTMAHRKTPQRFVLIRPKKDSDKRWLLVNTTPTKPIPYEKVHYTTIPAEKAEKILSNLKPGTSVQAKIDGAASLTSLLKDKIEVLSYRTTKEGNPIIHTERFFHGPIRVSIPKKYVGTVLRGELYGVQDGKSIAPQELSGILNSTVDKAIKTQKDRKIDLQNLVFDVHQLGNSIVEKELPYEQRMELLKRLLPLLPKDKFKLPEEAKDPKSALKMMDDIQTGKNPLTREGIVIHPPTGKPSKIKLFEEHDVYIQKMFPGEGKYADKAVGGFWYSLKPNGPIVGKVGTGFSDELRAEMAKNPDDYIGRKARVKAQEKYSKSGSLRAPALISLHEG